MEGPVYVYYSLTKFFLNQRDIARSRSYPQLRNATDKTDYKKCEGAKYVKEVFDNDVTKYRTPWGKDLNPNSVANPCGLQAKSYFRGKI